LLNTAPPQSFSFVGGIGIFLWHRVIHLGLR